MRALILALLLVGCSDDVREDQPAACRESIAEYCTPGDCVRDGVRSTGDFRSWCSRAGKLAAGAEGLSSCETHVIIDVDTGSGHHEFYYDKQTGELTLVRDLTNSPATCAGGAAPGCTIRSGVGVSCSSPP